MKSITRSFKQLQPLLVQFPMQIIFILIEICISLENYTFPNQHILFDPEGLIR